MRFLACLLVISPLWLSSMGQAKYLPLSTTFKGQAKFQSIARKAVQENWGQLPMSQRMVRIARELEGIPYKSYTLEIRQPRGEPVGQLPGPGLLDIF